MNPTTFVQQVTEQDIDKLRKHPDAIAEVDRKGGYATCFHRTILFFLTDDASPDDHHPLAAVFGTQRIECSALDRGLFHVLAPSELATLAGHLANTSLSEVKSRIGATDLEDLVEQGRIDDLDVLPDGESEEEIAWEIERLLSFYIEAAQKPVGLVIFSI